MSIDSYRTRLAHLIRDKSNLEVALSREKENIYRIRREISSINSSVTKYTSSSIIQSKRRQVESKERQLSTHERKAVDLEKKISDKIADIARTTSDLERTEDQEKRKKDREDSRKRDEEMRHARALTQEYERQTRLQKQMSSSPFIIDITKLPEKIVILFCASNPEDQNKLRLDEEIRLITEKIKAAKYRDSIELKSIWAIRPTDLLNALNEHKPTIVHFSGHGSEQDELVFHDDTGMTKLVRKAAIVEMFKVVSSGTRMVIFNTCFSENQAKDVTEHLEVAIGMKSSIGDEAARIFAAHLYSAIGFGKSVKESFEQAKVALMLEGIAEEDIPQLFTGEGLDPESIILVRP